jgi:hypothetical protein
MNFVELVERGAFLGEEFLIWLWMRGLTDGGSGLDEDQSACFIDDAVQLVTEQGYVKELSLSKGNPAESREAFEALHKGMRPVKAKVRLISGDMEWTFVLNAINLSISALKLPLSSSQDVQSRILDRMLLLEQGMAYIESRFKYFLILRLQDPIELQKTIKSWLHQGLEEYSRNASADTSC